MSKSFSVLTITFLRLNFKKRQSKNKLKAVLHDFYLVQCRGSEMRGVEIHEGGCAYRKVRYHTSNLPERELVCHCPYCQLRTGSAFVIGVYFKTGCVDTLSWKYSEYGLETQFGGFIGTKFCSHFGTALFRDSQVDRPKCLVGTDWGTLEPPSFWYKLDKKYCLLD